jgi:hypothetical protein
LSPMMRKRRKMTNGKRRRRRRRMMASGVDGHGPRHLHGHDRRRRHPLPAWIRAGAMSKQTEVIEWEWQAVAADMKN